MASTQDLETRLAVLEDKINWLFSVMQQQVQVSPMPGMPPRVVSRTFHEVYRDERQFILQKEAEKLARNRRASGGDTVEGGATASEPVDEHSTIQHTPPPALDNDPGPTESFAEFQQRLKRESGLA